MGSSLWKRKGGQAVKKIVIKTSRPEPDFSLIALLKALFPDCEIHIVFIERDSFCTFFAMGLIVLRFRSIERGDGFGF